MNTVQQAIDLSTRERPDAAIVDLNLNGETACDFVAKLAANLPCVIVSGYGGDALPASLSGIRQLEKPISPEKVLRCLAEELAVTN